MSFSVWTETRDKKESEQSKVFHLFSHDKGVFMSQLMQYRICICLALLVRVCCDYRICKSL